MPSLPPILLSAVRDQSAVLFLGAGAARAALSSAGTPPPLGDGLRDLICDRFLGGGLKSKSLSYVAAMAINEAGLLDFQKYIHDLFEPFRPAPFHELIPAFRWKAIATTNYDLIVERAYDQAKAPLQRLVKTVKDGDGFDKRVSETPNPVGLYKLHGSIDHYSDASIPLILSDEQYASYSVNRTRFYSRFRDLGYEYPIVFAGYSISDPHIQNILFDLTDSNTGRPMYFMVAPGIDPIEVRYWAKHRVTCIDQTLADFLATLDTEISQTSRQLSAEIGGGALSIRKHYRVAGAHESSAIRKYLAEDVIHIHSGMSAAGQDPAAFYRGHDTGWGCIVQNLDARRKIADSVLVDAVLVDPERKKPELSVLKGPAGNGKTILLKRIGWEAAAVYDQLVLFANGASAFQVDALAEIHRLTGKRIFFLVDRIALFRTEVAKLIADCRSRDLPISVIGAERDNEWNIYCEFLEPLVTQDFSVRYLSEQEIRELIQLLERHHSLGVLSTKSPDERFQAFAKRAERQLLVALHEATLGRPFEEIVLNEYERIEPAAARLLYLQICALHQFGAPVRAGLISRASGISFERFGREFMAPLENVVLVNDDKHTGDVSYKSRHQHVASLVFHGALKTPEEKYDLLVGLLAHMNVDYSSDRETFSRLIKGRALVDIFPSIELGRLFYDQAEHVATNDSFLFHQRAVFEMTHPGGSLVLADEAARRAAESSPSNHSIEHTQAEIARRLANETDDPLKKQSLRRYSRQKLGSDSAKLTSYDLYTRAKVAIDELRDELTKGDSTTGKHSGALVEAVKQAELAIQRGRQSFPNDAQILSVEADLRDLLDKGQEAMTALEKAFRSNPRQDWLAVRLAKRYIEAGDFEGAARVLTTCLQSNPSSKLAHLEYGRLLQRTGGASADVLDHLRRSFTQGDTSYEGQFWYARELFLQGRFDDAKKLFSTIHERAPGVFRQRSSEPSLDGSKKAANYDGRINRLEEGYAFVRIAHFPDDVFASRAESDIKSWEALRSGEAVTCELAFCRRGARAVKILKAN